MVSSIYFLLLCIPLIFGQAPTTAPTLKPNILPVPTPNVPPGSTPVPLLNISQAQTNMKTMPITPTMGLINGTSTLATTTGLMNNNTSDMVTTLMPDVSSVSSNTSSNDTGHIQKITLEAKHKNDNVTPFPTTTVSTEPSATKTTTKQSKKKVILGFEDDETDDEEMTEETITEINNKKDEN